MADPIRRTESVHIDETSCKATSTPQWFLEKRAATHPITHNNQLRLFICGEDAFEDIAQQISCAKKSIDICCWGFDPGMELVRAGAEWPRGETYGDLLIEAGKRGVKVRLLVWYDPYAIGPANPMNMPGYTHDTCPAAKVPDPATMSAKRLSTANLAADAKRWKVPPILRNGALRPLSRQEVLDSARIEYCWGWWKLAFDGKLHGIEVRTRAGEASKIQASLASEKHQPGGLGDLEAERTGMERLGTHHQKTILIDYDYKNGAEAVGYVKGLNSVTDYWDTTQHLIEDPRRETGSKREASEGVQVDDPKKADKGFRTFKPYRDYACRIFSGGALVAVHANFISAWDRAGKGDKKETKKGSPDSAPDHIPSALQRKVAPGTHSSVQIVRTQPQEDDKTIKEMYFRATEVACLATGYLYMENQYFQYQEWAECLIEARKKNMAGWKAGGAKSGKRKRDMPLLHVFIVIPVPERAQMIPRTYDILATLGQQEGMTGQSKLIDAENKKTYTGVMHDDLGKPTGAVYTLPTVVEYANGIQKPSTDLLEQKYGLKVAVAMLQTSGINQRRMRYREIYIHSKLLLVDDGFFSLGSANLNQRSMAVDSEINLATNDAEKATELRKRIWKQLLGDSTGTNTDLAVDVTKAFGEWVERMKDNLDQKKRSQAMTGFLLPLGDNRSSTIRLG
jgi:phosphatidylserine/phosphatidylglycerophosphate/cardiolipin synthase-like enzyme